jgi:hypothetical protein
VTRSGGIRERNSSGALDGSLEFFPREDIIGVGIMFSDASMVYDRPEVIEFLLVGVCEFGIVGFVGNAVPNCPEELDPIVQVKGFDLIQGRSDVHKSVLLCYWVIVAELFLL